MIIQKQGRTVRMIHERADDSTADALYGLAIAARTEFLTNTRIATAARNAGSNARMQAVERDSLLDALEADRQMKRWERHARKFGGRREIR